MGHLARSPHCASRSLPQEVVRLDSRLPQYGPERSFRHVGWMIRHRGIAIRAGIEPDFMATRGLTVELEAAQLQLPNDLFLPESCQAAHLCRDHDRVVSPFAGSRHLIIWLLQLPPAGCG